MEKKIRVVIADDHPVFREGLKTIIQRSADIHLVAEASTGKTAVDLVRHQQPDIILLDTNMPEMDGIETARVIRKEHPKTAVIAFSWFIDRNHVVNMIHAGAIGYVSKGSSKKEFLNAIQSVAQNIPYYATEVADILKNTTGQKNLQVPPDSPASCFTKTEINIIELICQQFTTREIAEKLCLGVRTIEGYRKRIEEKMQVKNTAGMVIYAIQKRIFHLPLDKIAVFILIVGSGMGYFS